ncbi:stabilizer of axonemal microtubules 4 [Podargus strigoides]
MTIGTKEHSGFTKALLRTDRVLPTQPDQPLSVSITTTDYQPFVYSNGSEKLPVLPVRSERGSGFTREVPSSRSLGTASLPTMYHPVVLISRGLEAPRVTQATLLGRQDIGRKELSGFAINHSQYVPPRPTLSPAAPTQCWQDPAWTVRSIMGIQPMRSSGFVTNNLRDTQPWQ